MRRLALTAALLAVLVSGCRSVPDDAMRGLVVEVSGDLNDVDSFTVLVEDERIVFVPSPDGDYAFPLAHLRDHLRSGEPVAVGWELVDGEYIATSIDDG